MKEEKKEKKFQLRTGKLVDSDAEDKEEGEIQTYYHNNAIDDDKVLNKAK